MLADTIQKDIAAALKSGDTVRTGALRFLLSHVRNAAIAKYGKDADAKLTETDILDVVRKQVKTHRESIEAFSNAGRQELAEKEKKELEILLGFLPPEMTDDELSEIIDAVLAEGGKKDFGPLMGRIMSRISGKADGTRVSRLLKEKLSR